MPSGASAAPPPQAPEHARWLAQAAHVKITRDDWGVPHVVGKTDAHAVFGMIYAQAEDDFNRVERNYLVSLGRLAEAEGESAIWQDLRQRLYLDHEELKALYRSSPRWLRELMDAWADGLNYFLATHPEVEPRVITRFEPWMALSFTEGSIGGDIERISLTQLRNFYDTGAAAMAAAGEPEPLFPEPKPETEPNGSNGIAIAPSHTRDGDALLLINPHTSHYFRHVQQVTSREGLDVYGAITWGQFFIYQGFNADAGWMHTSAPVDNIDEFAEAIVTEDDGSLSYRYGDELRPVTTKPITLSYRTADGEQAQRTFTTYATHHGPIVRETGGRWVATGLLNSPIEALQQSYLRTKARDYADYIEVANLKANSSNDTLFADSKGNIAFLLPQFMPIRDDRFNYQQPVDGSDPATDWQGLHSLETIPHVVNPQNGWVYNTNNWPWTCCGGDSPNSSDYPRYFNTGSENERGRHAIRLLSARNDFTLDTLRDAAFDSYLGTFAQILPQLVAAWESPARRQRAEGEARGADRAAPQLGLPLGRGFHRDVAGRVLGRRAARHRRAATRVARRRGGPADAGLRQLASALGRDQPLPAQRRRDHPDVRRREAERPGAVHVRDLGLARLVPGVAPAGDGALLRHERQHVRLSRGVRAEAARPGPEGGRQQRGSRLAALLRPGRALRERRSRAGLLRPQGPQGSHREDLQAGQVIARACRSSV